KFGLDLGVTGGGVKVWAVFTDTVAGPGFLAGEYVGATGEATLGAGIGANVLIGGSYRTVTLKPLSVGGQIGLNLAVGVAAHNVGLPLRRSTGLTGIKWQPAHRSANSSCSRHRG